MSELRWFVSAQASHGLVLPFDPDAIVRDWASLRIAMAREVPPEFTRDEWAYVIGFLDAHQLQGVFEQSFGSKADGPAAGARSIVRPRGTVAVWLPNNVSLLGPLTLILLSLTGNRVELKAGSSSENLTGVLLAFALRHLAPGPLKAHLEANVALFQVERGDARIAELAARAQVRIVFGSDQAAEAIHQLPHPLGSVGYSFVDRRSEAWVERAALAPAVLSSLIKVFAIYGQAGCTSPRKVVLIGGTQEEARALRDELCALWPKTVREVPQHIASGNVMARQWAAALGWDAALTAGHGAVLACESTPGALLEEPSAPLFLPIVARTGEAARNELPRNLQTLGVALAAGAERIAQVAARTRALRVVPLARMHHFGPVWDGEAFWRGTFETVEVQA